MRKSIKTRVIFSPKGKKATVKTVSRHYAHTVQRMRLARIIADSSGY